MAFLVNVLASALTLVILASPTSLRAQDYPTKPVRLILPFPPGGGTDTVGRTIAQTMTAQGSFGQPVVPDNRPGACGNLGLELAAKSAPQELAAHIAAEKEKLHQLIKAGNPRTE